MRGGRDISLRVWESVAWLRHLLCVALLVGAHAAAAAVLDPAPSPAELSALASGIAVPAASTVAENPAPQSESEFTLLDFTSSLFAALSGGATKPSADVVQPAGDRPASVPLPAALWLFGSGLGALGYLGRRRIAARRRRSAAAAPTAGYVARHHGTDKALRARLRQATACRPRAEAGADNGESGGAGGDGPARPRTRRNSPPVHSAFEQLAQVLLENPQVAVGRKFGRPCVKLGKRAFIACDNDMLAFRVGTEQAERLHTLIAGTGYWNPKQGPKPKHSWLAHGGGNAEALVTLVAAAYEHALMSAAGRPDCDADDEAGTPAQIIRAA